MANSVLIGIKLNPDQELLAYPNVKRQLEWYSFGGTIKFTFAGKPVKKVEGSMNFEPDDSVWEWPTSIAPALLRSVRALIQGKEATVRFMDSTNKLLPRPISETKLLVSWDYGFMAGPAKDICDVEIGLFDYCEAVFSAVSDLIEQVYKVNPELKHCDVIKTLELLKNEVVSEFTKIRSRIDNAS